MASPLLNLRVSADAQVRWKDAAKAAGVPLAEFVRAAVEEKIAGAELSGRDLGRALAEQLSPSKLPPGAGSPLPGGVRPGPGTGHKPSAPPRNPSNRTKKGTLVRARTELCLHRRAPDQYCPRCDL